MTTAVYEKKMDFKTADNELISNRPYVEALLDAIILPDKINIIKVKGHSRDNSMQAKGNNLADKRAKKAAERGAPESTGIFFCQDFTAPDFPAVIQQL